MTFYEMLSENYDEIFPFSQETAELIKSLTPEHGTILDVGSATGKYVEHYRECGFQAFGLEYCQEIIKNRENTVTGDMHALPFKEAFDTVVCTGNTLVHAAGPDGISKVLGEFHRVLRPGGRAVIQILNYHRIMKLRPENLPSINTGSLTFVRKYGYSDDAVIFTGELHKGTISAKSSVTLYPLTPGKLKDYAETSGFHSVNIYSTFDGQTFDAENSFMLVAVMSK